MAVVVLPTPGEPDSKAALCMDPSWSFLKNEAGINNNNKKKQIEEKEHYDERRDNLYYSFIHSISPFLVSSNPPMNSS